MAVNSELQASGRCSSPLTATTAFGVRYSRLLDRQFADTSSRLFPATVSHEQRRPGTKTGACLMMLCCAARRKRFPILSQSVPTQAAVRFAIDCTDLCFFRLRSSDRSSRR